MATVNNNTITSSSDDAFASRSRRRQKQKQRNENENENKNKNENENKNKNENEKLKQGMRTKTRIASESVCASSSFSLNLNPLATLDCNVDPSSARTWQFQLQPPPPPPPPAPSASQSASLAIKERIPDSATVYHNAIFACEGDSCSQNSVSANHEEMNEAVPSQEDDAASKDIQTVNEEKEEEEQEKGKEICNEERTLARNRRDVLRALKHEEEKIDASIKDHVEEQKLHESRIIALARELEQLRLRKQVIAKDREAFQQNVDVAVAEKDVGAAATESAVNVSVSLGKSQAPGTGDKHKKGRYVASRFLDWHAADKNGSSKASTAPGSQRKALSLGPNEIHEYPQEEPKKGAKSSPAPKTRRVRSLSMSPLQRHSYSRAASAVASNLKTPGPFKSSEKSMAVNASNRNNHTPAAAPAKTEKLDTKTANNGGSCTRRKADSPFRRTRIVASRYGLSIQSPKEKTTTSSKSAAHCSTKCVKNAYGKRVLPDGEQATVQGRPGKDSKRRAVASLPESAIALATYFPRIDMSAALNFKTPMSSSKAALNIKRLCNSTQKLDVGKEVNDDIDSRSTEKLLTDSVERSQLNLPKIKTVKYTGDSPRDSGSIKRVKDYLGKTSFFATDNSAGGDDDISLSQRKNVAEKLKQTLSFEENNE